MEKDKLSKKHLFSSDFFESKISQKHLSGLQKRRHETWQHVVLLSDAPHVLMQNVVGDCQNVTKEGNNLAEKTSIFTAGLKETK